MVYIICRFYASLKTNLNQDRYNILQHKRKNEINLQKCIVKCSIVPLSCKFHFPIYLSTTRRIAKKPLVLQPVFTKPVSNYQFYSFSYLNLIYKNVAKMEVSQQHEKQKQILKLKGMNRTHIHLSLISIYCVSMFP